MELGPEYLKPERRKNAAVQNEIVHVFLPFTVGDGLSDGYCGA